MKKQGEFISKKSTLNTISSQNTQNSSEGRRNSSRRSPFLKIGKFLKEIPNDPTFHYNNFEYALKGNQKQLLGTGAFGEVFLAKNKVDGKFYAIKHMDKGKIMSQGASLEMISREINIHRRISHENIIKMYSSHEDQNSFYLVFID